MKSKIPIIVSAAATSAMACSALAQDVIQPQTDLKEYSPRAITQPKAERLD